MKLFSDILFLGEPDGRVKVVSVERWDGVLLYVGV
jgi:hypothetical protein